MTTQTDLHGYSVIAEPTLAFDPTDRRQQSTNALAGLRDFGPFSARMQEGAPDTSIRIALLAPKGDLEQLKMLAISESRVSGSTKVAVRGGVFLRSVRLAAAPLGGVGGHLGEGLVFA